MERERHNHVIRYGKCTKRRLCKTTVDHHNSVMVFPVCPRSFSDTVSERHRRSSWFHRPRHRHIWADAGRRQNSDRNFCRFIWKSKTIYRWRNVLHISRLFDSRNLSDRWRLFGSKFFSGLLPVPGFVLSSCIPTCSAKRNCPNQRE